MNVVDEYSRVRVTLGFAAKNYGFEVVPAFASEVTVTSIAHDVRQVHPGCLFVPLGHVDRRQLEAARDAGAYAALVPPEFRNEAVDLGIPLLVSSANPVALGKLACDINFDPSSCIATFAVAGDDDDEIHANVLRLADFLHMLGNPVGVISDAGSSSLQRELSLEYPLNIADVQHTLSVCAEDGAAAVVIALNSATLAKNALQSVSIDVLGVEQTQNESNSGAESDSKSNSESEDETESKDAVSNVKVSAKTSSSPLYPAYATGMSFYALRQRYGFSGREHAYCVTRSAESDELAELADQIGGNDVQRHLSLSIAMVLAAGVRRGTIKSALRVSHELH
ncbi:UDP-N-acetylmuramyl peptide synthase [Gardnerella sp. Marseille-Q9179]|uniref:UDP-N-acetylmuramyl peptide synthase n=1 Tax=Gardnerella sp. Marseille-Q9179 TaxID=3383028 RepID=UPI000ED4722D|nr:UDP-N-acetylmuramyl peptide synthase [Bifidobacteriaceae bacterium NR015]